MTEMTIEVRKNSSFPSAQLIGNSERVRNPKNTMSTTKVIAQKQKPTSEIDVIIHFVL